MSGEGFTKRAPQGTVVNLTAQPASRTRLSRGQGDMVSVSTSLLTRSEQDIRLDRLTGHRALLVKTLSRVDAGYTFRQRPDLAALVNWSTTRNAPIHRWIRYREAYSPELIEALELGRNILDPFCGCGSMLVGAAARGRAATGIDINPLATFAAKVKAVPLTAAQLAEVRAFSRAFPQNLPPSSEDWLPDLSVAHKVFEPIILNTVLRIRSAIQKAEIEEPSRDFLHLCWIAILERVGSYFKEGNGIKYRNVQRRPGKYVPRQDGVWQLKRFGADQSRFVLDVFDAHLQMMLDDTALWGRSWGHAKIIQGNTLELLEILSNKYDSIVFSPPYANRFDYFESMKVELWFGGFIRSKAHMQGLRKASLRSHLSSDLSRPQERFEVLEQLIEFMDTSASSWRMGVPELLRGYFSDIVEVLRQCRERLKSGACYVVVGNSAFGGTIIPSDTLTALAGQRAGFSRSEIWVVRHLSVAPQQRSVLSGCEPFMRESIVVLRP